MKYINPLVLVVLLITSTHCTQKTNTNPENIDSSVLSESYTVEDFKSVPKIDTHTHINTEGKTMINMARANNFRLLNIAVDVSEWIPIEEQIAVRVKLREKDPDVVAFSTAFTLEGWENADWADRVISQLKSDFDKGANSVKVWKNIGMDEKDKDGRLIMLDDPKFDLVFAFIKDQGKVLLSHAGEPKNCWLPLDSMTVKNDYNYFSKNPKFHMYLHPEMPTYEEQILRRDNMIAKNPDLTVVAFHLASLEWSVDEQAKFLERFPKANLDLAERISHTQYQSQRNRDKVRDFFIKYQDRILYATDFQQYKETVAEELEQYMMETWMNDWKYFNTDEMVSVPQLDEPVQGLALPKHVVDKIYRLNAERIFPNAWEVGD